MHKDQILHTRQDKLSQSGREGGKVCTNRSRLGPTLDLVPDDRMNFCDQTAMWYNACDDVLAVPKS